MDYSHYKIIYVAFKNNIKHISLMSYTCPWGRVNMVTKTHANVVLSALNEREKKDTVSVKMCHVLCVDASKCIIPCLGPALLPCGTVLTCILTHDTFWDSLKDLLSAKLLWYLAGIEIVFFFLMFVCFSFLFLPYLEACLVKTFFNREQISSNFCVRFFYFLYSFASRLG